MFAGEVTLPLMVRSREAASGTMEPAAILGRGFGRP